MPCPICNKRKGKRFCPAKGEKICAICCASEREETIDCPFDCPHLLEARPRDYKALLVPDDFPYKEIRITETFLRDHGDLVEACGRAALTSALKTRNATDRDVREALDALIQTYKTLESGIYYESRPESAYAREIVDHLQEDLKQFKESETQQTGFSRTRDTDILHMLVFLYRVALDRDNQRTRGKAFLHFLRLHYHPEQKQPASSLIIPGS